MVARSPDRRPEMLAQRELWAEQREQGKVSRWAVRVTRVEKDDRTCPTCTRENGRRRTLRKSGITTGPPFHPNCRCEEEVVDKGIEKSLPSSEGAYVPRPLDTVSVAYRHKRLKRKKKRREAVAKARVPRDGDNDGFIYDGTPRQRPAPRRVALRTPEAVTNQRRVKFGTPRPPAGAAAVVPDFHLERAQHMKESHNPFIRGMGRAYEEAVQQHPEIAANLVSVRFLDPSEMRERAGESRVGGVADVGARGWTIDLSPSNIEQMHYDRGRIDGDWDHVASYGDMKHDDGKGKGAEEYGRAIFHHEFGHLIHMHVMAAIQHAFKDDEDAQPLVKTDILGDIYKDPMLQRDRLGHYASKTDLFYGPNAARHERAVGGLKAWVDTFSDLPALSRYAGASTPERVAEYIAAARYGYRNATMEPFEKWLKYRLDFTLNPRNRPVILVKGEAVGKPAFVCTFDKECVADHVSGGNMGDMISKAITPGGRIGDASSLNRSPKKNWVENAGGLPKYIRMVAHAMMRKGHSRSQAIRLAWGIVRNWASGKGNVSPKVRAAAAKAVAEMEAKRTKGKVSKAEQTTWSAEDYADICKQLDADDEWAMDGITQELVKGRRVRTPAGARFFNRPIGTLITGGVVSEAMKRHGSMAVYDRMDAEAGFEVGPAPDPRVYRALPDNYEDPN